MENQIKEGLDSVSLLKRITNFRSVLLILVLMLWVDLSLVTVTKTNLITHPWDEARKQFHYGWVAILSGAFLVWYVVIVPVVNLFIFGLIKVIFEIFDRDFSSAVADSRLQSYRASRGELLDSSLFKWGVDTSDELAIRLTTEKLQNINEIKESRANINHSSFAIMLLILVESIWPGSLFQEFVWPLALPINTMGCVIFFSLLVFLIVVATSWWLTLPFQRVDSYVYYPKAVHDDSHKRQ